MPCDPAVRLMTDLSVVVPVYNEAGSIEALIRDVARDVLPLVRDLEVIVVDDASTDDTAVILTRLAREFPWLRVHRAPRNAGHGSAVARGLDLARAEWVFQIDSDGQFLVSEVSRLWSRRSDCDLALGVRTERHDPAHRLILSLVVKIATSLLAGRRIRDTNTPFRLLRREVWADLRPLVGNGTLAPNIFVTVGAALRGWEVVEVPVSHLPRSTGVGSLRPLRLVRFSARGLGQLIRFRARIARAGPRQPSAAR